MSFRSTACKESKQCAPAKHHYDECVERVTSQQDNGGAKEDCVEECKYKPCHLAEREGERGRAQGKVKGRGVALASFCHGNMCNAKCRAGHHCRQKSSMLTNSFETQSSTSPTAQPNAPHPSSGPSSNKPIQSNHTTNRRPRSSLVRITAIAETRRKQACLDMLALARA